MKKEMFAFWEIPKNLLPAVLQDHHGHRGPALRVGLRWL